jgi:apolipoprotein N-acyltransferase
MIAKFLNYFKHYRLAILSGILIGTSYIPFPPWAILFAYVPLWWILTSKELSLKQVFFQGWWTQFVLTLIGFYWIAFVAKEYGYLPWPVAILLLFLFAGFIHLYIPLAALSSQWLKLKLNLNRVSHVFLLAFLTSLLEIVWPSLFPWNLGYTLYSAHLPWAQLAEYIGFLGLSTAILAINALITWVYFSRSRTAYLTAAAVSLIVLALVPVSLNLKQQAQKTDTEFSVLLVQPNIGNVEKYYAERGAGYQQFILDRSLAVTEKGLAENPNVDLVAWAETAFTDFFNPYYYDKKYPSQLVSFIKKTQKSFYLGAYSKDPPEAKKRRDYNATFLVDENANPLSEPYHKTHLLIFGEYAPFVETFPWIAKINPGGEGFGRGSGPTVFPFKNFNIGNQICYESLSPSFSAKLSRIGADVIFNVTNDSWFNPVSGPHFEAQQHRDMTLARTIEVRRPVVRITNTGYTTVALADGTQMAQSPLFTEWAGQYTVRFLNKAPLTFYARYGEWLVILIIAIIFIILFLGMDRNEQSSKK